MPGVPVSTTSFITSVFVQDSASTTGAGKAGIVYNAAGLTCYYKRSNGTSSTVVVLADITTLGTFAAGGFKAIDATNMPGLYEFHPPDAALASGATNVAFYFQGASGMAPTVLGLDLNGAALTAAQIATGVWQDATAGDFTTASSIGKSLYTSGAVPGATGGLFIAGTNAATVITTSLTTHFIGTVDTVTTVTNQLTAAAIATGVWQDATAGDFTTASSIGKALYIANVAPGAAGGHFIAGSNATTTVNFTGNLSGSVGSVTGAVGSVTGLTTATIATAVWTDTTAGDFTTLTSPGKIIFAQLGGTFTTTSSSVFSTAALANAPTGGSAPTVAQIATAVWQDATAGDFTVASSIGKSLYTAGVVPGGTNGLFIAGTNAATTITTGLTTHFIGTVDTVTTYTGNTPQTGDNFARIGAAGAGLTAVPPLVWDVVLASHLTSGTTGFALNAAGAAGDPWSTAIPGAYGAGTAGHRLGNIPDVAAGAAGGLFIAGTNATTTVDFTGNLSGSVGSVTAAVTVGTINTDAISAASVSAAAVTKIQAGLSTYAGGDTSGVTTLLARLTAIRAGYLDNLSAGAVALASTALTLTTTLSAARALDAIADTSLTINDAFHCAIGAEAGKEAVVGTTYTVKTPSTGTVLRTFTLDSGSAPTSRT